MQLTYYHVISQKTREIRKPFRFEGLESFVDQLVANYLNWMERVVEWTQARNRSIAELVFPFQHYRHGQQEISATVSEAIQRKATSIDSGSNRVGEDHGGTFSGYQGAGKWAYG